MGINITCTLSGLYDKNFAPLINNLQTDLQKWGLLNLSITGKIACIKINVLPRFLYLLQSILQNPFLDLLSSKKQPRVCKVLLQRHRAMGVLALPNLMYDYWAANLQKIIHWNQVPNAN